MHPGEMVVAIVAMSFVFATVMTIIRTVGKVAAARRGSGAAEGSGSMTGGELRKMITEAVNDATDPLYEKMDRLERKVDSLRPKPAMSESDPRPEIEIPAADEYEPLDEIAARRRSRV